MRLEGSGCIVTWEDDSTAATEMAEALIKVFSEKWLDTAVDRHGNRAPIQVRSGTLGNFEISPTEAAS